jgi:hypothetical protein
VDFTIVAAPAEGGPIKSSARRALAQADALFLLADGDGRAARERFAQWRQDHGRLVGDLPIYTCQDLPQLIERIKTVMSDKDRG